MAPADPPVLDARRRADVVARLVELARRSVPEWRPDAGPDPGTALQEIFGRLVELLLDRLNQVPAKTMLAFLDVAGIAPLPPSAATAMVSFTTAADAPVLVPRGAALTGSALPGGPPVPFETVRDLTVLPARLVEAQVVDPPHDGDADVTALVLPAPPQDDAPPVPVFAAGSPAAHVLHLGTDLLLDLARPGAVQLTLALQDTGPQATQLCSRARYHVTVAGQDLDVTPANPAPPYSDGEGRLWLITQLALATVDRTGRPGPGPAGEPPLRWLRVVVPGPLPETPVLLQSAQLNVVAVGLAPDAVLVGTDPADASRDFLPFGPAPAAGSVLQVGSTEALGKPGAEVTLNLTSSDDGAPRGVTLTLELLTADGWHPLVADYRAGDRWYHLATDQQLTGLPQTVTFRVPTPAPPIRTIGTTASRWIRVRITAGDYGLPASYTASGQGFTPVPATLNPPRLAGLDLGYDAADTPRAVTQCGSAFVPAPALPPITGPQPTPPPAAIPAFPTPQQLPADRRDDDPALYLGFDRAFPGLPVTLGAQVAPLAPARPTLPPVLPGPGTDPATTAGTVGWDYWNGQDWHGLTVLDGTTGFTRSGEITFLTPSDVVPLARFGATPRYWVRARSRPGSLRDVPWLTGIRMNVVTAVQGVTHPWEILGSGDGRPGQTVTLPDAPVLAGVRIQVREPEPPSGRELDTLLQEQGPDVVTTRTDPGTGEVQTWVRWHQVPAFTGSGPADRHITLEPVAGTVRFGDGVNGLVPPVTGSTIAAGYRAGGGDAGNLGPGRLTRLVTPVPGIVSVTNPWAADGGGDAENVTDFLRRAPQALRHRDRAVRAQDVAWLAREVAGTRVARAVCLPENDRGVARRPGSVTVVVVPRSTDARPTPSAQLLAEVTDGLLARAATTLGAPPGRLHVTGPRYLQVRIRCDLVVTDPGAAGQVTRDVTAALDAFLHPLTGGPDGGGWPLGRPVYESEVAQVLGRVPGVRFARTVKVLPAADQLRVTLDRPLPATARPPAAGDRVAGLDGRWAARVAQDAGTGIPVTALSLIGLTEGDDLEPVAPPGPPGPPGTPGPHPFRMTVADVRPAEPAGLLVTAERTLGDPPPPGTVLGTPDDTVRLVAAGPGAAGGLVLQTLRVGARLELACDGSTLEREVVAISPVASVAYLDPLALVHPGPHVVRVLTG